ncbi:hypothetical protein [Paenibacillus sp. NEAU-GSW1]|uniref:hypothetical protein n=1 Tax=Paenibacillus sp. NEAU-GSW1 TaxID=2682486 RepID=UPI0012E23698|nr:hypothetical protein [Paenibacillus sp. NEAU-GSW1]MUT65613.1 hypothetical protein [Paenibacillus sp. NEAU-GSW1]
MKAQQIQEKLESLHYWDARVLKLDTTNFVDDVILVFEDSDGNVEILFSGCSRVLFSTSVEDREKPLKEMQLSQIPYFIQDIEISDFVQDGRGLLNCKVIAPPITVEVLCKSITVSKE